MSNRLDRQTKKSVLFPLFVPLLLLFQFFFSPFILAKEKVNLNKELIEVLVHFNITTHIYFDSNIKYIDVGDGNTLIWKSVDNLIKISLSTDIKSQLKTNMTVHTVHGIYGFMISSAESENYFPYYFIKKNQALKIFNEQILSNSSKKITSKDSSSDSISYMNTKKDYIHNQNINAIIEQTNHFDKEKEHTSGEITKQDSSKNLDYYCVLVADEKRIFSNIGAISEKLIVYLSGIYTYRDKIFLKITFKNRSRISFNISYFSFAIKSKKNEKNQIIQEDYLKPLKEYPTELQYIEAKSSKKEKIYVFDKFIITKQKILEIYFGEKNGRTLNFSIPSSFFINAKEIK